MTKAVRLLLVSAGLTAGMRRHRFPQDDPLEARSQALALALKDRLPMADQALAAPARRASETAALLGLAATECPELRDQSFGAWSGMSLSELQASEGGALAAWTSDPAFAPEGGESVAAVADRASAFLDRLLQRSPSGCTIAVTHPAFVRTAILHVLSAPLTAFWRLDAAPLSLADLRCDGRRWALRSHGLAAAT
jgi:broad specificity phosphatase PhoE